MFLSLTSADFHGGNASTLLVTHSALPGWSVMALTSQWSML